VYRTGERWQVLSESTGLPYQVDPVAGVCECLDSQRGNVCKHVLAARSMARAIEKAQLAAADGWLDELERRALAHTPANQFEVDTRAIVRRAVRHVREQQAEDASWSTAAEEIWGPVSTREERETARPASYYRHNPARRWKQ
jgi:hypothetical protein